VRPRNGGDRGASVIRAARAALTVAVAFLVAPTAAGATPPSTPTITEPSVDGQLVHPADVHMEAAGFSDADGDTHACSDWQILDAGTVVWQADCATGTLAVHIHLGDGTFVNTYAGRTELEFDHQYTLQVRFRDSANEVSDWAQRTFGTYPPSSPGGAVAWTPVQPGYRIDTVADDLQLPTDIAFVPNPGLGPKDPLLYVTELYGSIKVINRDGSGGDYATGLLNFNPNGRFPGSGELGVTGIAVDPATGDVLASMVHDADGSDATYDDHYPEVVRLHSADGGHTAATETPVIQMPGEIDGPSHQISNLTIGPDGKLYVHNGDGFDPSTALNLNSFRGKILRMNLDGSAPSDNPFYDASDGINAKDYIYAYGFRNPFGGAWRAANGQHYEVENGPDENDRFARITAGTNYGWDGTASSMTTNALYNWSVPHAPVNIAFVQRPTFLGSGFPRSQMDHAFVTESGPTYATGPQELGKRIVEFDPQPGGEMGGHPNGLVEYTGTGQGTAVGLGAGPDGLYWTELYKDQNYTSAIDPGARLLRLSYIGTSPVCRMNGRTLEVTLDRDATTTVARLPDGEISVDGNDCGATVLDVNDIAVKGAEGNERVVLDLAGGPAAPGYLSADPAQPGIGVSVDLGDGHHDVLVIREGPGADDLELHGNGGPPSGGVSTLGVELVAAFGGSGPDRLVGNGRGNLLFGGPGPDRLVGGAGADLLKGEKGRDGFDAGQGRDRCDNRGPERARSCELGAGFSR
jgi:glucose/arabinose dehydrogenase